jgi:hypothetical protein
LGGADFQLTHLLRDMMDTLITIWHLMKPWLGFVVFIYLCLKMTGWARNRKAGAIVFGLFFQMILPDPNAEATIEAVVERKQEVKKQQDGDKEPKDEDDTLNLP